MFNEYWNGPGEKTGYQVYTPSEVLTINSSYNRMDIYTSIPSNTSASDTEPFGISLPIDYTATPAPPSHEYSTVSFGISLPIDYSSNNGSGFIISDSNSPYIAIVGLVVFFPILGLIIHKWR